MSALNRFELRLARKEARRTLPQKITHKVRAVISKFRKWWYNEQENQYVNKFNNLKCAEDLPVAYGNV